jgi:hypothetical protein
MMLGNFLELAFVIVTILGDGLAHMISSLDQVIEQVAVAGLGHTTVLGLKVTGTGARPPKVNDLGNSILGIAEIA